MTQSRDEHFEIVHRQSLDRPTRWRTQDDTLLGWDKIPEPFATWITEMRDAKMSGQPTSRPFNLIDVVPEIDHVHVTELNATLRLRPNPDVLLRDK